MQTMTIGKRTLLGFSFMGLLCVGISWFAINQVQTLNKLSDNIAQTAMPGLIAAFRANAAQAEAQLLLNQLVRAEKPEQRKEIRSQLASIGTNITAIVAQYDKLVVSDEDRRNFDEFKKRREEFWQAREKLFAAVETNRETATALLEGPVGTAYTAYGKAGEVLVNYNAKYAQDEGKTLDETVTRSVQLILVFSIVGIVIGIGAGLYIIRGITSILKRVSHALEEGAMQVASAAGQVAGSSQSLAEGASEQAASLEETSSSLEEMASMTKRNADGATQANELARQARVAADAGAADMELMNQSVHAIKASSDEIAKIIKTIDEIAFQTNILALNAAVEAARAGEAGMGFAVVADEVRNLAQRCAQSAKETALKIDDSVTKTAQGVEISKRVAEGLQQIVTQVRQVDELVGQVAASSKEQSQGVTQINTAVTQMDQVTQSNAASAEESAAAAEEMNAQADALKSAVEDLLRLAGGRSNETSHAAATKTAATFDMPAEKKAQRSAKPAKNGHARIVKPVGAVTPAKRETVPAGEDGFRDF